MKFTIALLLTALGYVGADCECGYVDEVGNVWMERMNFPFDRLGTDLSKVTDLVVRDYDKDQGFGTTPFHLEPDNVYIENGELVLRVKGPSANYVSSAEIVTRRNDILYGTFRAEVNFPREEGTCAALFFYRNDTQEIDVEYLGQNPDKLYVSYHTLLHNATGSFMDINHYIATYPTLSMDRQQVRFDWTPKSVDFYVNGTLSSSLYGEAQVPSTPGRIMLDHWSSGDKDWSGGPPLQDVFFTVKSLEMFFNSSDVRLQNMYGELCSATRKSCRVQELDRTELYGSAQTSLTSDARTKMAGTALLSVAVIVISLLLFV